MGMTVDDLCQRLRACEAVLSDCSVDTHGLLSKGQSDIVLEMMSHTTISSDDIGPVTELILRCRWAEPSQKTALLKMVGSLTHSAKPRAKLQDFEALAMFISEQMWAALLNNDVDYHSKAALLRPCSGSAASPSNGAHSWLHDCLAVVVHRGSGESKIDVAGVPARSLCELEEHAEEEVEDCTSRNHRQIGQRSGLVHGSASGHLRSSVCKRWSRPPPGDHGRDHCD